jgi:hypothetical protein
MSVLSLNRLGCLYHEVEEEEEEEEERTDI